MLVFQELAPIFTGGNGRSMLLARHNRKKKKKLCREGGLWKGTLPFSSPISYRWRKQSRQPIQVGDYATIYDQFQKTSRVVGRNLEASTRRFVNFVTHICHSTLHRFTFEYCMYECIDFVDMFILKNHKNRIILLETFSGQIIIFQQPRFFSEIEDFPY